MKNSCETHERYSAFYTCIAYLVSFLSVVFLAVVFCPVEFLYRGYFILLPDNILMFY